jgi:hypothetical protein
MIKHYLKKYLKYYKVKGKISLKVNFQQLRLVEHYQALREDNALPSIDDTGLKIFSQFEEDGKLLFLFSLLEMSNRTFIEFGSDDGINSNSANLYYHHMFTGLFMDGNPDAIERGKYFFERHKNINPEPVKFKEAHIKVDNINELIKEAAMEGEIGLLSIDIDGNDYWIWKAMDVVQPQVVIIETHNEFGMNDIVVPYDSEYIYPGKHPTYHGASPIAMTKLAKHKGYRLVGSNDLGFNFIYLRNDLLVDEVPEVSVESLLQHPSNAEARERFKEVEDWDYLTETFN